jgi:hypothetical protein
MIGSMGIGGVPGVPDSPSDFPSTIALSIFASGNSSFVKTKWGQAPAGSQKLPCLEMGGRSQSPFFHKRSGQWPAYQS